jgi:hypothetical protein
MLIKLTLQAIVNENLMSEHRLDYAYRKEGHCLKMKQLALKVSEKVMFDFLCHFFENSTMQPISENMGSVMTFSDSYANFTSTSEPSVLIEFINRAFMADGGQYFFDIMFNCVDQSARNWIGSLASTTMIKAMRIYGICCNDGHADHSKVKELGTIITEFMTRCFLKL